MSDKENKPLDERTFDGVYLVYRELLSLKKLINSLAHEQNWKRLLTEYKTFNWESIGAIIIEADEHGPTVVEWNMHRYQRRSPENKYGADIWYSRAAGRDESGDINYIRLITFTGDRYQVDDLSQSAKYMMNDQR